MQQSKVEMLSSDRHSIIWRARWTLGLGKIVPLYLAWQGLVSLAVGTSLLVLPFNLIDSPVMGALYHWVSPVAWGAIFLLLGVTCWAAVIWPRLLWRHAMFFLFEVQALWAIGLSVPVLMGVRPINAIAPMAWSNVVGTTVIILEHARRFTGRR